MKILILSSLQEDTPPSGYGGIERFVDYLAIVLTNAGHIVNVVCKESSPAGVYTKTHTNNQDLITKFKKTIDDFKPDIIHINQRDPELISYLNKSNIPVVITLHNNVRKTSSWVPIFNTLKGNFHITTISENLKQRLLEAIRFQNGIVHINGITNLSYGMDISRYMPFAFKQQSKDYYVYIGSVVRYKGVLDIVKQFEGLNEKLLVVGPEDRFVENDYIKLLHKYYAQNQNIEYFGETHNEVEKIELIKKAKGLIIATGYDPLEFDCYEAFGLVMLEANALGVPVFGYAKGNVKDFIIDGYNGYKFDDIKRLPELFKMASSQELFKDCLENASRYDIAEIGKKYEEFFSSVLKAHHEK